MSVGGRGCGGVYVGISGGRKEEMVGEGSFSGSLKGKVVTILIADIY